MLAKKGDWVGKVVDKWTEIERKGWPEHDSDYLRVKMEYNLMAMDPGVSREESIYVIDNDLPWTFSKTDFYLSDSIIGNENKVILKRIL
jgi:hypothetical protein